MHLDYPKSDFHQRALDLMINSYIATGEKDSARISLALISDIYQKLDYKKYNLVVGMYHDQVLTPAKTLFDFNAINITVGLPFIRISPDHGPNESMVSKNISNPLSLIKCIDFFRRINAT